MAEYDFPKGRVMGGGAGGPAILRAGGLLIILLLVVILLFASMAQVDAGTVAVLTLVGKAIASPRHRAGARVAARHPPARHVKSRDRSQAAGRAGVAGHDLPPAKRKARGRPQAH